MSDSLAEKYRPRDWDEVTGNEAVVSSLRGAVAKKTARAFLFVGPSGVGKTTLALIAAKKLGCTDIQEIDAATYTGIDDMRAIADSLQYRPLEDGIRGIIIDEAHGLSRQAFDSLLKVIEKPPAWVYWFFCTTVPTKVPTTIKTRCLTIDLKPVPPRKLIELVGFVASEEGWKLHGDFISLCANEAQGSPRQAIANLAAVAEAKNIKEAQEILRSAEGSAEAIELARLLYNGARWPDIAVTLGKLKETNPESVRHVVRAYMTSVATSPKSRERDVGRALEILDAFSTPFNSFDGLSPLVLASGKAVLQ